MLPPLLLLVLSSLCRHIPQTQAVPWLPAPAHYAYPYNGRPRIGVPFTANNIPARMENLPQHRHQPSHHLERPSRYNMFQARNNQIVPAARTRHQLANSLSSPRGAEFITNNGASSISTVDSNYLHGRRNQQFLERNNKNNNNNNNNNNNIAPASHQRKAQRLGGRHEAAPSSQQITSGIQSPVYAHNLSLEALNQLQTTTVLPAIGANIQIYLDYLVKRLVHKIKTGKITSSSTSAQTTVHPPSTTTPLIVSDFPLRNVIQNEAPGLIAAIQNAFIPMRPNIRNKVLPDSGVIQNETPLSKRPAVQTEPLSKRPAMQTEPLPKRPAMQTEPHPMRPAMQTEPRPMRPAMHTEPHPMRPAMQNEPHPMRPAMQTEPHPMRPAMRNGPHHMRPAMQTAPHPMRPAMQNEPHPMRPAMQNEPHPMRPPMQNEAFPMRPAMQNDVFPMRPAMRNDIFPMRPAMQNDVFPMRPAMQNDVFPMRPAMQNEALPMRQTIQNEGYPIRLNEVLPMRSTIHSEVFPMSAPPHNDVQQLPLHNPEYLPSGHHQDLGVHTQPLDFHERGSQTRFFQREPFPSFQETINNIVQPTTQRPIFRITNSNIPYPVIPTQQSELQQPPSLQTEFRHIPDFNTQYTPNQKPSQTPLHKSMQNQHRMRQHLTQHEQNILGIGDKTQYEIFNPEPSQLPIPPAEMRPYARMLPLPAHTPKPISRANWFTPSPLIPRRMRGHKTSSAQFHFPSLSISGVGSERANVPLKALMPELFKPSRKLKTANVGQKRPSTSIAFPWGKRTTLSPMYQSDFFNVKSDIPLPPWFSNLRQNQFFAPRKMIGNSLVLPTFQTTNARPHWLNMRIPQLTQKQRPARKRLHPARRKGQPCPWRFIGVSGDCSKYIECYIGDNQTEMFRLRECPGGYVWNNFTNSCDYRENVPCIFNNPCFGVPEGINVMDAKACYLFYVCEGGEPATNLCDGGLNMRFDPSTQNCVEDPTCSISPTECRFTPVSSQPTLYRINPSLDYPLGALRSCIPRFFFNEDLCTCVHPEMLK